MPAKAKPVCKNGHPKQLGKGCDECSRQRALARYYAKRDQLNPVRNEARRGTYQPRSKPNADGDWICKRGHVKPDKRTCQICRVETIKAKLGSHCPQGHERESFGGQCLACQSERIARYNGEHREEHKKVSLATYYRRKLAGLVECSTEKTRAWKEANRERWRELQVQSANKRRILKLNAEGSHTLAEWKAICERQGGLCAACGLQKKLTRDHIFPLSKGGSDYATNIQGLCGPCNSRKGASLAKETE